MPKCFLDKNLETAECEFGVSGVTDILLAKHKDIDEILYDPITGVVTTITMVVGKKFYRVPSDFNAGYTKERVTAGASKAIKLVLGFTVPGYSAELKAQLEGLLVGTKTVALVERADGLWVMLGDKGYLRQADGAIGGSGVAETDESGTPLQLEGTNKGLEPVVDPTIIEALVYVAP